MSFFSRIKNLLELSKYEIGDTKGYAKEEYDVLSGLVKKVEKQEAVFIPYQKIDPVKEITQEQT